MQKLGLPSGLELRYQLARWRAQFQGFQIMENPYDFKIERGNRSIRISRDQMVSVPEIIKNFDALLEMLRPQGNGEKEWLDFLHLYVHTHSSTGDQLELARCCLETDDDFEIYFQEWRPTREDLVFDLGAEFGVFTHLLARMAKHVVTFDPDGNSKEVLRRNVARNKLRNVTVAGREIRSF